MPARVRKAPAPLARAASKANLRPEPAAAAILAGIIALTPLCLLPGVFLSHDVIPKVIAIMFGASSLLLLWPQWSSGLNILWTQQRGRWFLALAAAQILSLILSTLFSNQLPLSVAGTVWRRFGSAEQIATLVIAIATASLAAQNRSRQNPSPMVTLYRAISISGGLGAFYGIAQYFGLDPFLDPALYRIDVFDGIIRPPATMGHAIYFAAWIVPVVLLAASHALEENSGWSRIHLTVAVLGCVAILLSGTRGAVLAVAVGALVLFVRKRRAVTRKTAQRMAIGAGLLVTAAALFTVSPAGGNFRHRLYQWRQDLGGPRLLLWRESPALLLHHPLLGTGPETFAVEFRKIESAAMSRAYPDFYHETPHNAFLDAATGQGIPGLLILAGVFALGLAAASPGLQAAVAGILVSAMFASFTNVQSMFLWTLVAFAAGISGESSLSSGIPTRNESSVSSGIGTRGDSRVTSASPNRHPRWIFIPAILTAALFTAVSFSLAVPDAADQRVSEAVAGQDFGAASRSYKTAIDWSFGLPGYELFLSREMATLGRALGDTQDGSKAWKLAADAAALAEQRGEERFSAAFQSSVLAIASGNLKRAELEARIAEQLAPNWYKPHLLLAQILQAAGRTTDGEAEQRTGRQLLPLTRQPD
jgi:O-antigen ligase